MKVTQLKGGSLSSTSLIEHPEWDVPRIRKTVSTVDSREYGYVRWYSQLKKLQRIGAEFPALVPSIIDVGLLDGGRTAYFDMEYLDGFKDMKTLLTEDNLSDLAIEKMHAALWRAFGVIHNVWVPPASGAPKLYYQEEVKQKLGDAVSNTDFHSFLQHAGYKYNGVEVSGIQKYSNKLEQFFNDMKLKSEEMIHGNPTLENLMYSTKQNQVVFIDVYEESCIDSKYLDYSQVLQCSRSHYGYLNDREISVNGNEVWHSHTIPEGLKTFNRMFEAELGRRGYDLQTIDVLEATQFIRMLPFKCLGGQPEKAKYFYTHACYLLEKAFG